MLTFEQLENIHESNIGYLKRLYPNFCGYYGSKSLCAGNKDFYFNDGWVLYRCDKHVGQYKLSEKEIFVLKILHKF